MVMCMLKCEKACMVYRKLGNWPKNCLSRDLMSMATDKANSLQGSGSMTGGQYVSHWLLTTLEWSAYVEKEHTEHLLSIIKKDYKCKAKWEGKRYWIGNTIKERYTFQCRGMCMRQSRDSSGMLPKGLRHNPTNMPEPYMAARRNMQSKQMTLSH